MLPLRLLEKGIYCVPFAKGGTPLVNYAHWRERPPDKQFYADLWEKHKDAGILMLCENIEVIDLDEKNAGPNDNLYWDFEFMLDIEAPELRDKIYIESTKSGGYHYIFRTKSKGKSCVLASRPLTPDEELTALLSGADNAPTFKTLVDYLAHGKLCRIAPSVGYRVISGDILNLPELTQDEVDTLLSIAKRLNKFHKVSKTPYEKEGRPGDIFNNSVDFYWTLDQLTSIGWNKIYEDAEWIRLSRPGARNSRGTDGTISKKTNAFFCLTTSEAYPNNQPMSPFSLYTHLNYGGDWVEAAKELARQGFRSQRENDNVGAKSFKELAEAKRMSFARSVSENFWLSYENVPVAGEGMLLMISGKTGSFKSQTMASIVSGAIGHSPLGFDWNLPYDKRGILWFDTEQNDYYAKNTFKNIHIGANKDPEMDIVNYYMLLDYKPEERMAFIENAVNAFPECGVVVIDGMIDLSNYRGNSEEEASQIINWLLKLKSKGILIMMIMHEPESKGSDGKAQGHLGSALMGKVECYFQVRIVERDENDRPVEVLMKQNKSRGERINKIAIQSRSRIAYVSGREPAFVGESLKKEREAKAVLFATAVSSRQPKEKEEDSQYDDKIQLISRLQSFLGDSGDVCPF